MTAGDPRSCLASMMPIQRLDQGIHTLRELHTRIRELLEGKLRRTLEHDDYGCTDWYIHLITPAIRAIASDGWVERHLYDFTLLAESPALSECCRATVLELFSEEAFHVAIQHYPLSDGLVQALCHELGDKVQRIQRIAGQLTYLRLAHGSYPPTGIGLENASSVDCPAFKAIPVR